MRKDTNQKIATPMSLDSGEHLNVKQRHSNFACFPLALRFRGRLSPGNRVATEKENLVSSRPGPEKNARYLRHQFSKRTLKVKSEKYYSSAVSNCDFINSKLKNTFDQKSDQIKN